MILAKEKIFLFIYYSVMIQNSANNPRSLTEALERLGGIATGAQLAALLEAADRVMLETRRFDRTATGRRTLLSGLAVDLEFAGVGENWRNFAKRLLQAKRINAEDEATIRLWDSFGSLIGNSDRHLGNLSFFSADYQHFSLAPAYDMLPMRLAPSAQGELIERTAEIAPSSLDLNTFAQAANMAEDFWRRVQIDERLAGRMTAIANSFLEAIARIRQQMGYLNGWA